MIYINFLKEIFRVQSKNFRFTVNQLNIFRNNGTFNLVFVEGVSQTPLLIYDVTFILLTLGLL